MTGRTRVPGHARAKKTGWPYRQRGGPGKCGAVRTSRPAAEELSATRGTVASVVRCRRSLFAFCALGGLVRGSPARIANDDITSLRARARGGHGFSKVFCCFLSWRTLISRRRATRSTSPAMGNAALHVSSFRWPGKGSRRPCLLRVRFCPSFADRGEELIASPAFWGRRRG